MHTDSKKMIWTGRVMSGLMIAFLLMDGVMHLTKIAPVVEASNRIGVPMSLAVPLGLVELICVLAYAYPRTSILGAILLTGYLGGAVAIHLRAGSPLFGETLFPVYVGILLWEVFTCESRACARLSHLRKTPFAAGPPWNSEE